LVIGVIAILAVMVWQRWQRSSDGTAGTVAFEFPDDGNWINADKPPSMTELRGRVVLLQFSFIGCTFCRKMDPVLLKWHQEFEGAGLSIVEVDDGRIDSLADVRAWATDERIPYWVLFDTNGKLTELYGVRSYPTLVLVGRDGKVAWRDHGWPGEAGVRLLESEIKTALSAQK